jgi:1-pyrroline-5-carboxylate dehydrogenase
MTFKLTYSTMFDPPEEMHSSFEVALAEVRSGLGATHAMYIDGADIAAKRTSPNLSPVDRRLILGHFPVGEAADVDRAVAARSGRFRPAHDRTRSASGCPAGGGVIEERVYHIGAALALEVGKNRMESLGKRRRPRTSSPATRQSSSATTGTTWRCPTIRCRATVPTTAPFSSPTACGG